MSGFQRYPRTIPPALAKFTPVVFPAGGGFSASYPSGLQRWWDAQALTSLHQDPEKTTPVTSDSDPVGSWTDLKNAVQATQATANYKPLYKTGGPNGAAYVQGDGIDDYLATSNLGLSDFTILWVGTIEAFDDTRGFFGDGASGFYRSSSNPPHTHFRTNGLMILYTLVLTAVTTGAFYIVCLRRESTALTLRMNGAINTNQSPTIVDTETLNISLLLTQRTSDYYADHKFCELLFYNRAQPDGERSIVEAYLSGRYLIPLL